MKVIDMHCDTISRISQEREAGKECNLRQNELHIDSLRLQKSHYLMQSFALYVNQSKCKDPWDEVLKLYQIYQEEMQSNQDIFRMIYTKEDLIKSVARNQIGALLTVEEGGVCKGEIEKLEQLYQMGVRLLTLTWNYPNELGYPNHSLYKENTIQGLTTKGREFVNRMEEMGMLIDVSHLSDAGFYDVVESSKKPFVASHSNARAITPCVRNLTDDMIRKVGERGGLIGLNFCTEFLLSQSASTIDALVKHAQHIINVGGIECIALGSDFDGIDTNEELQGAQDMEYLWEAFKKIKLSNYYIEKIFYKNTIRIFRDVLK